MRRTPFSFGCILATSSLAGIVVFGPPRAAHAEAPSDADEALSDGSADASAHGNAHPSAYGNEHDRPHVKLDQLELPRDLIDAKSLEAHLRRTLRHEVQHADWGAGSASRITYRFFVEQLELREEAGVLHVSCTALGRLPRGKSAKSHIAFGGDPRDRKRVVEHVLDIVARGVVTRLAELERARRTP